MRLKRIEDFEVLKRFFSIFIFREDLKKKLKKVLRLIRIEKFGIRNIKYISNDLDLKEINKEVENTFLEYWNYCVYSDYCALDFVSEVVGEDEESCFLLYNATILSYICDLYKPLRQEFRDTILRD
jgi:hypothetical protein